MIAQLVLRQTNASVIADKTMPAQQTVFSYDYSLISQSGIGDDLMSGIKNFVVNNFDTKRPIRGIFKEFLAPGVIWSINPILGIAYELAGALGFVDWNSFWDSIIDPLESLVSSAKASKPSDEDLNQQIQTIVDKAANQSFKDNSGAQPTEDQIKELQKATGILKPANNHEAQLIVRSIRQSLMVKHASMQKTAGWASSIFKALFKFLVPKITWLAGKTVRGLLMTSAAGVVATLTGNPKAQEGNGIGGEQKPTQSTIANLIPSSKSAPQELYEFHSNSITSVWIENGDIADAPANIMGWIIAAYPQLKKYEGDIESSSAFRATLSKISQRNKLGRGAGFYIIPPPAQRKIDLVADIVSNFVNEHLQSLS